MHPKISNYPLSSPFFIQNSVLVGGCFDLLHYGHLCFLKSAAEYGSLIVALEGDETIIALKKQQPIHTQQQRAEILAEMSCIQHVLLLPSLKNYDDYLKLVESIRPSFLAITQGDNQMINKQKQADKTGAKLIVVNSLIDGLSSSLIRQNHL